MIYLLKSAEYENNKFFFSLKIGYTNDEETDITKNKRLFTYFAHHRSIELLHIIPNGTEEQEKKLHYKFRKYLWVGDEWYYYSNEIVNYIKSVTLEELDKLPIKKINIKDSKKFKKIKRDLKCILEYSYNNKEEIDSALLEAFSNIRGKITNESILKYLEFQGKDFSKYYEVQKRIEAEDFGLDRETNHKVSEFLKHYQQTTTKLDKLKLLCSLGEIDDTKEILNLVLDQLQESDQVKSYFVNLGFKRIKELGFNLSRLNKALGIISFSPELLQEKIYSEFKEGDEILWSEIKNKLTNIYSEIQYEKTPKAINIKEFFEVKEYSTSEIIEGKRQRYKGYKLIKKLK